MLERVVGIMFRAAYGRDDNNCSSPMAESASTSSATGGNTSQPKQEGDIEIDNSNHVLVKIATLYAERLMNDICLVVGGVEYPAHRLILCASSEVFQVMLMNPRWSESHESRVVLQESPSCAKIFGEFLRYFYTGQIRINHLTIMPILILADKYNVKDLIALCLKYMCNHIAHAAAHNQVVTWFQYSFSLGHYQVAQACENFVKWNFESVAKTGGDFGNFQIEMLSRLLQQNDLVVQNEMTIYNCVVNWLDHQKRLMLERSDMEDTVDEEMEGMVQAVMAHVRFPMMTPRQLAELLLSPLTSQYKEFFIQRMAIGMSYHSDQTERIQEVCQTEGGCLLFTPRLYTADKWSSLLTVDNFTQIQPYYPQTLMFSSQAVCAEYAGDRTCDWVIDLYPKGVWFQKFFLIVWQGTVEVPESVLRTVRLSVTCKDPPGNGQDIRVRVGLLIMGVQDGIEHVMSVITRNHRFSEEDKVLNFDDVLSFDELNDFITTSGWAPNSNGRPKQSPFLVGDNRDTLKINIVITPLSEVCSVENADGSI